MKNGILLLGLIIAFAIVGYLYKTKMNNLPKSMENKVEKLQELPEAVKKQVEVDLNNSESLKNISKEIDEEKTE